MRFSHCWNAAQCILVINDVSGKPVGLIIVKQSDSSAPGGRTGRLSRNVGNYQSPLRNIQEERRSEIRIFGPQRCENKPFSVRSHYGEAQKSFHVTFLAFNMEHLMTCATVCTVHANFRFSMGTDTFYLPVNPDCGSGALAVG